MNVLKTVIVLILKAYKLAVSPVLETMFGKACRFEPTCGVYAVEVIEKHGVVKGGRLALKRLLKCNPFYSGYKHSVKDLAGVTSATRATRTKR